MTEKITNTQKRLHELMSALNIKQNDIADKTGLNKSTISNYCNGNRVPNQTNLAIIADAFNISPAWLMGYEVNMMRNKDQLVDYIASIEERDILMKLQEIDESDRELILATLELAYQKVLKRKKQNIVS